jgi:hypothetical protein
MNALEYAMAIIENYEMDIRDAIESGILPAGFCQGTMYTKALEIIKTLHATGATI